MKTKVYILAGIALAAWMIGGGGPGRVVGNPTGEPPTKQDDCKKSDDGAAAGDDSEPMAGPKGPAHQDPPPPGDDDGINHPRRDRRAEWRERRDQRDADGDRGPRRGAIGERRRERMRYDDDGPIPEDVEAHVLAILQQHMPELHLRLSKLKEDDVKRYNRALRRILPMMNEFMELQKDHPEMAEVVIQEFQAERDVRSLVKRYNKAREDNNTEAQAAIEVEFRELMTRRHDLQMRRRRFRLEDFRERLERERQRLEEEEKRIEAEQADFAQDLERRVQSLRDGKIRDAVGPPPGERRRGGRFDGPPHRGPGGDDMDGPPRRGRHPRGLDGPPHRHGPGDGPRPPRDGDDDRPPPPDDDLDI
ncbi:MAG: hypothetical protein H6818_09045 [Phycisphaerales bacterium]|nr:hypothetical protein [Phycisphaerales bacterium]MCB9862716.1 hypothetical protein [Phycisphaerales bacterium]